MPLSSGNRAVVFIDGSNFYHSALKIQIATGNVDYPAFCQKLVAECELAQIRYYAGQIKNIPGKTEIAYAKQRAFFSYLTKSGVQVRPGIVAEYQVYDKTAKVLRDWLSDNSPENREISTSVHGELLDICARPNIVQKEKGVDMMCGMDMVGMGFQDEYETAYLISSDGDFAPAVDMIRQRLSKQVVVCSPAYAHRLKIAAGEFVHLKKEHFDGCMREVIPKPRRAFVRPPEKRRISDHLS